MIMRPSTTPYTMADYVAAYESEDYPNAIAIWDALAEANAQYLIRESGGSYDATLPPIFASFMPKSGGTFLYNRMIQQVGYVDYPWVVTRWQSHTEAYPTPLSLAAYRRGGFFGHTHAVPSPYFRMVFGAHDAEPVWVHLRNPAEACLAGYFHYLGEGQGEGKARDARLAGIEAEKVILRERHGFTIGSWPAFFRRWLGFYAGWVSAWLSYREEYPERVFFTYFDELTDLPKLLHRVFRRYGLEYDPQGIAEQLPDDRRRKTGNHAWQAGLSDEDIASQADHLCVWNRVLELRNA